MAIYTGDVNRVTGLSGFDTESMIDKMMKAESAKYEKLQKNEIWVGWKQEAYREIIKSMQDFQNKWFSSTNPSNHVGFESYWNNFNTTVKDNAGADSSAITIKGAAQTGKYELEVQQVAQAESITGKSKISGDLTSSKSLDEIYNSLAKVDELNFKFDLDGLSKEITITKAEVDAATGATNGEKLKKVFQGKLDNAFGKDKITLDDKGGKAVFSSKNTSSLTITDGKEITKGVSTSFTGVLDTSKSGDYKLEIEFGGNKYTVETKFEATDDAKKRVDKVIEAFKTAKNSSGGTEDLNKKISLSITADGNDLKVESTSKRDEYKLTSTFTESNGTITTQAAVTLNTTSSLNNLGFSPGKASTTITQDSKLTDALGESFKTYLGSGKKLNFGGKEIEITGDDTIRTLTQKIEASGAPVKVSFNQVTARFKIESVRSGKDNEVNITDTTTKDFLKQIGIDLDNKQNGNDAYVQGQNAKFVVDGITVERDTNDVNMNGLQFTINSTTNGKVTINSSTDEKSTFDKIKAFVDDYNKLIETVEGKVNEKREKSGKYGYYEPLLDSEKKSLKEDEIKKWEEKAKTGLLNRDDLLNNVLSSLRNIPYQRVDIGGKQISLSDIGIKHSSNYKSGKLEIDEEKLKKAISEKGDDIKAMFTKTKDGIADKINKVVEDAIGRNGTLRTKAGIKDTTSVSNNLLSRELREISKRIAAEKERLYKKEMSYYKLFSKMESAMNKQNSQMSMMLGLLGQ